VLQLALPEWPQVLLGWAQLLPGSQTASFLVLAMVKGSLLLWLFWRGGD
jgi:hypothetical protein